VLMCPNIAVAKSSGYTFRISGSFFFAAPVI
jgi:hypothetical protein